MESDSMIFKVTLTLMDVSATGIPIQDDVHVSLGFCAATLIGDIWLITTASCFDQTNRILYNTAYVHTKNGIKKIEYCQVIKNPEYRLHLGFIPVNDVVLLKLRQTFDNITPLDVNTRQDENSMTNLKFVYKLEDDRIDNVALKILSFHECMKYFTPHDRSQIEPRKDLLEKTMFCTIRPENPPGYCANINGSPLISRNKIVGLVSLKHDFGDQGRICYRLYMFTRLSTYYDWIQETMDTNNENC